MFSRIRYAWSIAALGLLGVCQPSLAQVMPADDPGPPPQMMDQSSGAVFVPSTSGSSDIKDWYAPDNKTLVIRTYGHGSFKATLSGGCAGMRQQDMLGFSTPGPAQLDSSTVVVLPDGQRCSLKALSSYPDEEEQRDRKAWRQQHTRPASAIRQ